MNKLYNEIKNNIAGLSQKSITVDEIERSFNAERYEVIDALKRIAKEHNLRFIVGRKGNSTRVESHIPLSQMISSAAMGNEVERKPAPNIARADKQHVPAHTFILRADPEIIIRIPIDITDKESERLKAFVTAVSS